VKEDNYRHIGPVQICLNYKASVQKLAQMNHPQCYMKTR